MSNEKKTDQKNVEGTQQQTKKGVKKTETNLAPGSMGTKTHSKRHSAGALKRGVPKKKPKKNHSPKRL